MKSRRLRLGICSLLLIFCLCISPALSGATDQMPFDDDNDDILSDGELSTGIIDYMSSKYCDDNPDLQLPEDLTDAVYVYVNWDAKPKTVTDMKDREMTFYRPIKRIITTNPDNSRLVLAYGDGKLLVGADICTVTSGGVYPWHYKPYDGHICKNCQEGTDEVVLSDLPETNTYNTVNYELMASLKPDVILDTMTEADRADDIKEKVGVPVFVAGTSYKSDDFESDEFVAHMRAIGDVLSREDEAEELVAFFRGEIASVTDITDEIPEDEKPRVYFAPRGAKRGFYDPNSGRDFTRTVKAYEPLTDAGGINVVTASAKGKVFNVNIEQIIAWNPDVILLACSGPGYEGGVDFILNATELQSINAVKNKKVYNVFYPYCYGMPADKNLINCLYIAKILHPAKFADLDVETEGNKIMKAFLRLDGVYTAYAEYLGFPNSQKI